MPQRYPEMGIVTGFITPLKSQIDIPSELVELASSKQILILPISLRDVADLSFTTWVKQTDGDEKITSNVISTGYTLAVTY